MERLNMMDSLFGGDVTDHRPDKAGHRFDIRRRLIIFIIIIGCLKNRLAIAFNHSHDDPRLFAGFFGQIRQQSIILITVFKSIEELA